MGPGAIHGQQEGLLAPEDEGSLGSGRTMAPGMTPLGEPGREPPIVGGMEQRVEWARQDVVARVGQEAERARRVPGGGTRKGVGQ